MENPRLGFIECRDFVCHKKTACKMAKNESSLLAALQLPDLSVTLSFSSGASLPLDEKTSA